MKRLQNYFLSGRSRATILAAPMEEVPPQIRWKTVSRLGSGASGQVFLAINLDTGELLALKRARIGDVSVEQAQAHIRELENEAQLMKNLSHPNILRCMGTIRQENTLDILLEFVAGGSISSLLSKCGPFPEALIRMYTKQILQGLDCLHQNKIIHRDIKGPNILLGYEGCIKLADFGVSKQVTELEPMAFSVGIVGTPFWMAPEIVGKLGPGGVERTSHSFPADIWSLGCTVIEMAIGKQPWSDQYSEPSQVLYRVGTTQSHPPIPEHLSANAKNFLFQCLQVEPGLRPTASDLLQHPFVTGQLEDVHQLNRAGSKEWIKHAGLFCVVFLIGTMARHSMR